MSEYKDLKRVYEHILNIKPPLGIMPKEIHEKRVRIDRFNDICRAITQYYEAGLKIDVKWIEEYNELIEFINRHHR